MAHNTWKCPLCKKPLGVWTIFTASATWADKIAKLIQASQGKKVNIAPAPGWLNKCAVCGQLRGY